MQQVMLRYRRVFHAFSALVASLFLLVTLAAPAAATLSDLPGCMHSTNETGSHASLSIEAGDSKPQDLLRSITQRATNAVPPAILSSGNCDLCMHYLTTHLQGMTCASERISVQATRPATHLPEQHVSSFIDTPLLPPPKFFTAPPPIHG